MLVSDTGLRPGVLVIYNARAGRRGEGFEEAEESRKTHTTIFPVSAIDALRDETDAEIKRRELDAPEHEAIELGKIDSNNQAGISTHVILQALTKAQERGEAVATSVECTSEAHKNCQQHAGKRFMATPKIFHSETLVDRKSCFIGHAAQVSSMSEIEAVTRVLANMKFGTVSLPKFRPWFFLYALVFVPLDQVHSSLLLRLSLSLSLSLFLSASRCLFRVGARLNVKSVTVYCGHCAI